ncbi:MAG: thioredoxin fold domain-containing protein [Rhodospirillales bacterium]|nr:thioredoxin fold domain-containing protein [Rhodospirillales bacterium]
MKTFAYSLLALLVLVGGPARAATDDLMRDDGIHMEKWMHLENHNLGKDLARAKKDGKGFVILYEQPGCTACAGLHAEVLSKPDVVKFITKGFNVHLMNTKGDKKITDFEGDIISEEDYANQRVVAYTPSTIFYDGGGEEVFRLPGYLPPLYYKAAFKYVREGGPEKKIGFVPWVKANMERLEAEEGS